MFSSLNREAHNWLIKKDKLKESGSLRISKFKLQSDAESTAMMLLTKSLKQKQHNAEGETVPSEQSDEDDSADPVFKLLRKKEQHQLDLEVAKQKETESILKKVISYTMQK